MSTDLRHRLGRLGESLAAEHLERRGFAIVARNHRTRFGEIDIVAHDGTTLVICEVKTRRAGPGSPRGTLGEAKRPKVRLRAGAALKEVKDRPPAAAYRFD